MNSYTVYFSPTKHVDLGRMSYSTMTNGFNTGVALEREKDGRIVYAYAFLDNALVWVSGVDDPPHLPNGRSVVLDGFDAIEKAKERKNKPGYFPKAIDVLKAHILNIHAGWDMGKAPCDYGSEAENSKAIAELERAIDVLKEYV
jgi:hypothetical protein